MPVLPSQTMIVWTIICYLLYAASLGASLPISSPPVPLSSRQDVSSSPQITTNAAANADAKKGGGGDSGKAGGGSSDATNQILSAMATISGNIDAFTSAVTTYQGGLFTMIPVETAELNLQNSITACASVVQGSKPLSEQDNAAVAGQIATILPKISGAANGLIVKAPQMQQFGVTPIVIQEISNIQVGMNDLSSQLQRIVTSQTVPAVQSAASSINGILGKALQAFSPPPSTPTAA